MQKFILPLLVAVLAFSLNSFRTTTNIVACSNTFQSGTTHDNTMADVWIPIRNRGRAGMQLGIILGYPKTPESPEFHGI